MYGMVQPVAEVVWDSVQTIVDRDGVHEMQPETEDEWEFVQFSALALAESANLIMVADRPLTEGTPERSDNWNEYSEALITTALEAADAARARDPEALFTAGSNIYENACLACHDAYLPENAQPF
jgi:mono/diheme cytochrome c family protein